MSPMVVAAIVVPIMSLVSVGFGRWLAKSIGRDLRAVINETVEPQLSELRKENRADHAHVAGRIDALDQRVGALEARLFGD